MKYFSICAIVKDEGLYISEWLQYHSKIGAEKFYIYDNESTDNTVEVIKNLPLDTVVTSIKGIAQQGPAYTQCLRDYRKDSRWIAFIDADEFLVPKGAHLHDILKDYEYAPGLLVHWRYFGSNDELVYKPIPVVERFTKRMDGVDLHVKTIGDPVRTLHYATAHRFMHGGSPVDENHKRINRKDGLIKNNLIEGGTCNRLQLNHYVTKSWEEHMIRHSRMRADLPIYRENLAEFFRAHDRNEVEDLDALKIWQTL